MAEQQNSALKPADIGAIVNCLKITDTVKSAVRNLQDLGVGEIIVACGGFAGRENQWNEPGVRLIWSAPGLKTQTLTAVQSSSKEYLLFFETDHRVNQPVLTRLLEAFPKKPNRILGLRKLHEPVENDIFEKFFQFQLLELSRVSSESIPPSGVYLLRRSWALKLLSQMRGGEKYDFDTSLDEARRRIPLAWDRLPEASLEVGRGRLGNFLAQAWRYGNADAQFFAGHWKSWSMSRRIQSLLHPAKRYFWGLARIALKKGDGRLVALSIFFGSIRYTSWLLSAGLMAGTKARSRSRPPIR